jgi:hypothetical protein
MGTIVNFNTANAATSKTYCDERRNIKCNGGGRGRGGGATAVAWSEMARVR